MVAPQQAKPIDLLPKEELPPRTTPLMDSIRLFRRNRVATIGLVIIVSFFLMALTANLWTRLGIIDARSGYKTFHEVNPPGLPSVDSFADPGTCAREGL